MTVRPIGQEATPTDPSDRVCRGPMSVRGCLGHQDAGISMPGQNWCEQPFVYEFSSFEDTDYEKRPYSDDTVAKIRQLAPYIKKFSDEYDVPPLAVAGSIAEEFDTSKGGKGLVDWIQDHVAPTSLEGPAKALANTFGLGWDLGPANLRPTTSKDLVTDNPDEFPGVDPDDSNKVEAFSVTDSGTCQLAAKYVKKAKNDLVSLFSRTDVPLSQDYRTALYVDYFRQGPKTLWNKITKKSVHIPVPPEELPTAGYGARVIAHKDQLLKALGDEAL